MADETPQPLLVTPLQRDKIARGLKKLDNITGLGVVNGPDYLAINPPQARTNKATPQIGTDVLVKITGNGPGGGAYTGRILTGTSTATGLGTLAMPEGLTVPAADDALVLNEDEDGLQTHWLKADSFAVGRVSGTYSDKTIVVIPRGVARTASPQAIGISPEGTTTANADTWDRSIVTSGANYGDVAMNMQVITRVVYDHAGDEKLYGFYRTLRFAADGKLASVTAETRYEIDAPEDC